MNCPEGPRHCRLLYSALLTTVLTVSASEPARLEGPDSGALSGGETTVFDATKNAFSYPARNLAENHRAAFFVGNFTTNAVTIHLIPYLADRGYSPTVAAVMIGWMGAMQLPARLLFTPISSRFARFLQRCSRAPETLARRPRRCLATLR